MKDWTEFGLRGLPSMSCTHATRGLPPVPAVRVRRGGRGPARPLVGISSDGNVRPGLFPLRATGVTTAPILDAAQHFLATLDPTQRAKVVLDTEANERRQWFNVHPTFSATV